MGNQTFFEHKLIDVCWLLSPCSFFSSSNTSSHHMTTRVHIWQTIQIHEGQLANVSCARNDWWWLSDWMSSWISWLGCPSSKGGAKAFRLKETATTYSADIVASLLHSRRIHLLALLKDPCIFKWAFDVEALKGSRDGVYAHKQMNFMPYGNWAKHFAERSGSPWHLMKRLKLKDHHTFYYITRVIVCCFFPIIFETKSQKRSLLLYIS